MANSSAHASAPEIPAESRVAMSAELEAAVRVLSHELRTPIAAMLTLSDMLCSERFGPLGHPKYREYAESIKTGADHALRVLGNVLDDAVGTEGLQSVAREPVDLISVIEDSLRWIEPGAVLADITIERVFCDDRPMVATDEGRLRQILANLLGNALKFTPNGGRITVGCQWLSGGGGLEVRIDDTGVGIAKADLNILNGSLDAEDCPNSGGSPESLKLATPAGVGLVLVRRLAEACGALFVLASERGRGTSAVLVFEDERIYAK